MPYSPEIVRKRVNKYICKNNDGKSFLGRIANLQKRNRLAYKYGIEIGLYSKVGSPLNLPHPRNIIIGDYAVLGHDCTIYNDVVIGTKGAVDEYPTIGNNVTIFAGAKIFGKITIGDNCIIGANAVVTRSFQAGAVIAGVPAKEVKKSE